MVISIYCNWCKCLQNVIFISLKKEKSPSEMAWKREESVESEDLNSGHYLGC